MKNFKNGLSNDGYGGTIPEHALPRRDSGPDKARIRFTNSPTLNQANIKTVYTCLVYRTGLHPCSCWCIRWIILNWSNNCGAKNEGTDKNTNKISGIYWTKGNNDIFIIKNNSGIYLCLLTYSHWKIF